METEGEVQGQLPDRTGSEDLDQMKCQPCLNGGQLHDIVGMCTDCQEYLCSQCFSVHTVPTPSKNHKLLKREQLMKDEVQIKPKDICTEKCIVHEDEVVKYYCKTHFLLGCSVCIIMDHKACHDVRYIPHAAKELASNEEYRNVEKNLNSALETLKNVSKNASQNVAEVELSCQKAMEDVQDYHKKLTEAQSNAQAKLTEQANAIKSKELEELLTSKDRYKSALEDLSTSLSRIELLQKAKQNCSSYIEMMKTNAKLKILDSQIKEAEIQMPFTKQRIHFLPNREILDMLQHSSLGVLSASSSGDKMTGNCCTRKVVSVKRYKDINVKGKKDKQTCWITGLDVLPDNTLVLADHANKNIKLVSVQNELLITQRKMSSAPWDIATICAHKVAVTLPNEKRIDIVRLIVSVLEGGPNTCIDRTLHVDGDCHGIDYKNDKLAISFTSPGQVQIINLQGSVLYSISVDKHGNSLFYSARYLTFGQDDSVLYVSNWQGAGNVVCVKLDGTVVAEYSDGFLRTPQKAAIDDTGNIFVIGDTSHSVHQITKDCQKIRVVLSQNDGLKWPYSICFSADEDRIFVGMVNSDSIKAFTAERKTECNK